MNSRPESKQAFLLAQMTAYIYIYTVVHKLHVFLKI